MKAATLCTGVGGFDLAFNRAGIDVVLQCEIEKDCRSVLRRHWPHAERTEDVYGSDTEDAIRRLRPDVLGFGSPCQDLSVAGRRAELAGKRSGVFFRCMELAFIGEAPWVVFENVPGLLSSCGGEDFATVLEAFTGIRPEVPSEGWRNTGCCIGPLYSVAWSVLDAQWFGVPQRRRRVFVVGHLGDRARPYEVLSLGESLPWDSPPSREARARVAASLTAGVAASSGVNRPGRRREDDVNLVAAYGGNNTKGPIDVATCLNACGTASGRQDFESETFVAFAQNQRDEVRDLNNCAGAIAAEPGMKQQTYVAYAIQERAISENPDAGPQGKGWQEGVGYTLEARHHTQAVANRQGVRRLTPREAERLQGFPDQWTRYAADGKEISDSARYRMLGNSVAVPVVQWIAERIAGYAPPSLPLAAPKCPKCKQAVRAEPRLRCCNGCDQVLQGIGVCPRCKCPEFRLVDERDLALRTELGS